MRLTVGRPFLRTTTFVSPLLLVRLTRSLRPACTRTICACPLTVTRTDLIRRYERGNVNVTVRLPLQVDEAAPVRGSVLPSVPLSLNTSSLLNASGDGGST